MNQEITDVVAECIGPAPGKSLLVLVGVHGNETCGLRAVERVTSTLELKRGKVIFVRGNPHAIAKGIRFTEANLNRMFLPDEDLRSADRSSYEYRRSRDLIPLLEEADALLDIHSSATKASLPFIIAEPTAHQIARLLPVLIISSGWNAIEPGATEGYMERLGKVGICIECGYHEDESSIDIAERAIRAFIAACGNSDEPISPSSAQHIRVEGVYKSKIDFRPCRQFDDFEPLKSGTLIGTDGDEKVIMEKDGLVIFVRMRKHPGEEAFVVASSVPSSNVP